MKPDRRPLKSKLAPFATELLTLNDAGKKLLEIRQWLAEQGMSASINCISNFLARLRTSRAVEAVPVRERYRLPYYPKLQRQLAEMRRRREARMAREQRTKERKAKWYRRHRKSKGALGGVL